MIEYGDTIVAATGGGLLIFDRNTKTFSTLTNIDGLVTTDLQAVAIDPYGNLWLGGGEPDGLFQVYDLRKKQSLYDSPPDFGFFEVTGFATSDSIVYGIFRENQDVGLFEFIYQDGRFIYRDVYRNWPIALGNIVSVTIYDDYVWVGTDYGLLQGNWKRDNLKDPDNWTPVAGMSGNITTMRCYGKNLLIVNDKILYLLDLPDLTIKWQWNYFANSYLFKDIVRTTDGEYWGILNRALIKLNDTAKAWQINTDYSLENLLPLDDNTIVVGTATGFSLVDATARRMKRYIPNAPVTNQFSAVTVLTDGRVVAGSKFGLAIKEPEGWRNIIKYGNEVRINKRSGYQYFEADTVPIDFGGYIADLEQGPDGLIYCGIRGTYPYPRRHGGGIVIIDIDNPANYELIDTTYLDYFKDEYMVVKDLEFDQLGNLWVADTYSTHQGRTLHVRNSSGDWGYFQATTINPLAGAPGTITIDNWQRVWVGAEQWGENPVNMTNGGLAMLEYTGDPASPETIAWAEVKTTISVWSTVLTPQNVLYILTPEGLTGLYLQNSLAQPVARETNTYFPNISFGVGSRVKLDPQGNAWTISPDDGVNVLMENATYWPNIAGLRFDNSMLLSNNTTDIDFDADKGLAYITSKRGLNALKIPFAKKKSVNESLKIFPSPYHIPNESPLVIDGINDISSIKIMTVAGEVIRTIKAGSSLIQGYQAFWDGRDKSGNWVNSGVYLIFMYNNDNGNEVAKITVIKH